MDEAHTDVWVDGTKIGTFGSQNLLGNYQFYSGNGTFSIPNLNPGYHEVVLRFMTVNGYSHSTNEQGSATKRVYIESVECKNTISASDRVITGSAGDTFAINPSLGQKGFPGYIRFCHTLPFYKQAPNNYIYPSVAEIDLLLNGSTVTVPPGEVWLMQYKSQPINLAQECQDLNAVWNPETNTCGPQIILDLSNCATYDSSLRACIETPIHQCVDGTLLTETNTCDVVIQPTTYVCEGGGNADQQNNVCYWPKELSGGCVPEHGELNTSRDRCEKPFVIIDTSFSCPADYDVVQINGVTHCVGKPVISCENPDAFLQNGQCVVFAPPAAQSVSLFNLILGAIIGIVGVVLVVKA